MRHIIISDTHAPLCINQAFDHAKEIDADAIVINGDLLGVFSMSSSNLHKEKGLTQEDLINYLKSCAPNFFEKLSNINQLTKEMVLEYVQERYDWCINILKKFSKINKTIFNMGNHESKHHFLVLQELSFLLNIDHSQVPRIDTKDLEEIFVNFEKQLYEMENTHNFKYIRDNVLVTNNTLVIGIPGESHSPVGLDSASLAQEKKTLKIIEKAKKNLPYVFSVIIYHHTQGDYNQETGNFQPLSDSLRSFMKSLPVNIFKKVFVQSHNHWAYTQFIKNDDWHIVMNNAGLHGGIFNVLDLTDGVECFDADPIKKKLMKLKSSAPCKVTNKKELIARYYENPEIILKRKIRG